MKIKITMRHHFIPTRMTIIKKYTVTNVGKDLKKLEPSHIADGNENHAAYLGNNLAVPQKVKHRDTI